MPKHFDFSDPRDRLGMTITEFPLAEGGETEDLDLGLPESSEKGETDLQGLVTRAIEEAVDHFRENIEPTMAEATDYYFARPFGDEVSGRSQVISTDVRDATLDQIPDLLEIFMGSDSVVEFKPRDIRGVEEAQQATDAVNYVFYDENQGFLILNAILKDGAVRKVGYVKWWHEEVPRLTGQTLSGLTETELKFLEKEEIEFEIVSEGEDVVQGQGPDGQPQEQKIPTFTVDLIHPDEHAYRVEEVPPEEIVWTPEARKFSRAPCVAHVREVPREELVRMGISEEFIEDNRGVESKRATESLRDARQFYGSSSRSELAGRDSRDSDTLADSQELILFAEAYMLVDSATRPGQSELRLFECVGPEYQIWNNEGKGELVSEIPIALFTPDPEPHTVLGLSNFDYLKEIQRVKSQIQRGQLNSLAQAIENQMVVATKQVNLRDLVAPEISGLIRVKTDVGAVREIKHQFVGPDTLPVLEYYDQIRADRTGRAGPREGLNANILQSTSDDAVHNTLSKQQQRIRMVARTYAETGFRELFMGIYRMLIRHQDREMMIKVRGKHVQVDPRNWDAGMRVSVNVALGTGSVPQRVAELQAVIGDQKEHMAMGSPLVSFVELRNSYGKLLDVMGYKDTETFYKPFGQAEMEAYAKQQQEAAENADPDPQQVIAETAQLEVQSDAINKERELDLKEMEIRLKDERERMKLQLEHQEAMAALEVQRAQVAATRANANQSGD